MILFTKATALSAHLQALQIAGQKIGFVPTMGALHAGHLSLIAASKAANNVTVCSIFINPTQFNNAEDFKHYPVTNEGDIQQLLQAGCNVLFLPAVTEMYPPGYIAPHYNLGKLETLLEGEHRPGHFQGVCQVMDRFLTIVHPDRLYMGQKDFQQCMVVKKLLQLTERNTTELHLVPTRREESGLAMSSRNLRLSPAEKQTATTIAATLLEIKQHWNSLPVAELKQKGFKKLSDAGFAVDYVEIVHADDLSPVTQNDGPAVALIAATLGNIRLIDNMLLN